jgi:hypothetical protein
MYRTAPIRASRADRAAAASDHGFCRLVVVMTGSACRSLTGSLALG